MSDTKHVNTTIAQAYINNQGQHVTITDAELYLTFLTERAGYLTSIGYYYYKTNEIPNSPDKVDKFIIIPNASIAGDDPYTGWSGSGISRIGLEPSEKNVTFCFSDFSYTSPAFMSYEYQLEGRDDGWIAITGRSEVLQPTSSL